jgi:hypothetical protein
MKAIENELVGERRKRAGGKGVVGKGKREKGGWGVKRGNRVRGRNKYVDGE